ncbi:MAG: MFS transporter [Steroidobacteraceae bacterium]
MTNDAPIPAMHRWLNRFARVEPREAPAVVAAFFLFFFVLGSYFALRPVRETIATLLGRERVADLWMYTAAFSIAIVPIYGWLVGKVRRSLLLPWIFGATAIILGVIGTYLRADETNLVVGTFFYIWISVLNLMLVSVCWSFLLEMFTSEQSKRLFGLIAAGGTLGALVGPLSTRLIVSVTGNSGVFFLGTAGFVGAIFCQRALIRIWQRQRDDSASAPQLAGAPARAAGAHGSDRALGGNPFAGILIVLRSPYLIGIALFVVLLSAVNTFLYFEQLRIVEETIANTTQRTEFFANIDIVVQTLTILSQLILTGRIASTFGVRALLTVVPVIMIGGFMVLAASNLLITIAALLVLRRWGEYAFIRPGREMLFAGLDTETKYKAKNFVDVPVYRLADWLGAQAKTALEAIGTTPVGAALIGAGIALLWAVNGWALGSRHDAADAATDSAGKN